MKKILCFFVLFSPSIGVGADYSKCVEIVRDMYHRPPFRLTDKGDVIINKWHRKDIISYNTHKKNEHFVYNDRDSEKTAVVTRREDGSLEKIVIRDRKTRNLDSALYFEIRNGQCIPTKKRWEVGYTAYNDDGKVSEKRLSYTVFDLILCRELEDFFVKNPKVAECFKDGSIKKVADILLKHYPYRRDIRKSSTSDAVFIGKNNSDNDEYYDDRIAVGKFEWSIEGRLEASSLSSAASAYPGHKSLRSPVQTAQNIIHYCRHPRTGLAPFLDDKTIWQSPSPASSSSEGGKQKTRTAPL